MARGMERGSIFRDDSDRADLLTRISRVASEERLRIYAWSFLPNHIHLLVRSGPRPLGRALQRLLTGYAARFNRRHERSGHLFQNRFASVLCDRDDYLLELIRYVHLNPIRHGVMQREQDLARFRWCGHGAMLGLAEHPWQATSEALSLFGGDPESAVEAYRAFLVTALDDSAGDPLERKRLILTRSRTSGSRSGGRETFGRGEWVLTDCDRRLRRLGSQWKRQPAQRRVGPLESLVSAACEAAGAHPRALRLGSRCRSVVRAREVVAHLWIHGLGLPTADLLPALGIGVEAIRRAAYRGRSHLDLIEQLGNSLEPVG